MLVLSRKPDEQIMIGDGIVVTVVEIRGDKVRLGIDAPREIAVHRKEVLAAIQKQAHTESAPAESASAEIAHTESASAEHPQES